MSTLLYLLQAWLIGIAIAAPLGPIGMLCIKKTLELGIRGALLVGLGAAMADSCYGLIAALGLTAISQTMIAGADYLKLIGGLFLLYIAYKEIQSSPRCQETQVQETNQVKLVGEVFFLTITNPMTILSFMGIFASFGRESLVLTESIAIVLGIFLGSMTWWCILGATITKIKDNLPQIWFGRIKWISCFILGSFGLIAIFSTLIK